MIDSFRVRKQYGPNVTGKTAEGSMPFLLGPPADQRLLFEKEPLISRGTKKKGH